MVTCDCWHAHRITFAFVGLLCVSQHRVSSKHVKLKVCSKNVTKLFCI